MTTIKLEEIREKTVEELKDAIVDYKKQLFDLRLQKSLHKLENTSQVRKIRHIISQMKTVINQKQEKQK